MNYLHLQLYTFMHMVQLDEEIMIKLSKIEDWNE